MDMTKIPGPKAARIVKEFKKLSYDSTFTYPLVIKTGSGCRIEDMDGNKFLDSTSNRFEFDTKTIRDYIVNRLLIKDSSYFQPE